MKPAGTLLSIQYLRGLAALAVAAMHTGWTRTGLGAAGVDVFFVISGFIMVFVSRREVTPAAFLRARILRVVPLYWLVTAVAIAVRQDADPARIVTSFLFWPHAGFDGRDYPVVIQGWTLNYEAFFYAVFALALLARAKLETSRRLVILTVALGSLVALGIILRPADIVAATYTGPLLLEFLAGAWLCRVWQRGLLPQGRVAAAMLAVGVLAFAAQVRMEPGTWRIITWGLPALLVVSGSLGLETGGSLPRLPGLLALGDASYALYLTHLLVQRPLLPALHDQPTLIALPVVIVSCIVTALLVYRFVERPLHGWTRRGAVRRIPGTAQT